MPHSVSHPSSLFINIHCHRPEPGAITIVNLDSRDFDRLPSSDQSFSAGIHPWFICRQSLDMAFERLQAVSKQSHLLAIGECGLDRAIPTPLPLQVEVFCRQIELAEELGKPLIVHCVRAFDELLRLKKQLSPVQPWIVHGFCGKPALAEQLLRQGCYLSLGKALLQHRASQQTMASIDLERVFLETDDATDVSIGEIYAVAAKIRRLDLPDLQRQLVINFQRVFTHD